MTAVFLGCNCHSKLFLPHFSKILLPGTEGLVKKIILPWSACPLPHARDKIGCVATHLSLHQQAHPILCAHHASKSSQICLICSVQGTSPFSPAAVYPTHVQTRACLLWSDCSCSTQENAPCISQNHHHKINIRRIILPRKTMYTIIMYPRRITVNLYTFAESYTLADICT